MTVFDLGYEARISELEADNARLRAELHTHAERLQDYEHRISWEVTCAGCATGLDRAYEETMRREQAEQRVAELEAQVRSDSVWISDLEDLVLYAEFLLDQEPLWMGLARMAWAPVEFVRFVVGAAKARVGR